MKLDDILALRPADDADAAALQAALNQASTARVEMLRRAADALALRTEGLLVHDDKTLLTAERDAAAAKLAVDRLDTLLPTLRNRLNAARGLETLASLRAEAKALDALVVAVRQWQEATYPTIAAAIGAGLHAQQELIDAMTTFTVRVDAAYARAEVRASGPLGVNLPVLTGPEPRALFPNWANP